MLFASVYGKGASATDEVRYDPHSERDNGYA